MILYFSENYTAQGMKALNTLMSYTGPITATCYKGVNETLSSGTFSNLEKGDTLLVNILYNAGYMYTDVFDIITGVPSTGLTWPYYLAFQVGDFFARFLYESESTD